MPNVYFILFFFRFELEVKKKKKRVLREERRVYTFIHLVSLLEHFNVILIILNSYTS